MQSAAKVGLLLVVFIGLLIGGFAVLGKNLFAPVPDVYYADVPDAQGVTEGTRVLMAGVEIGEVSKISLAQPRVARLKLGIHKGTFLPEGSRVTLSSSLIGFGESPVIVVPPDIATTARLAPGSVLENKATSPLDAFVPEGKETLKELNRTMVAVRKLLEDQKLQNKVTTLMDSSNKTIEQFGILATKVNGLIADNHSNLNKAMASATAAITDVHKMTARLVELVASGKLQNKAVAILDKVKVIEGHADELVASINKLVNDPKLRGPATEAAANIADITNTGKQIANNTAEMTKNGVTISQNAATVSSKAIALTDKANEIAGKASQIEDQLKGVLDKVGGFFNKGTGTPSIPKFTTGIDLMRSNKPGYWRTDLGLQIPLKDETLDLGIYDAFESNRITAELAKPVTNVFGYRYGIYASKPALGVDYRLAPRLSLRGDAWDINDPRLDLRASYEFGNGLIGWLGVDRVLKDNALTFGIGIRR